jgi:hypothetical protein
MPSSFIRLPGGFDSIYVDPESDLDYSIASWIEGVLFNASPTWAVAPSGPVLYNGSLNGAPVTIDGVTYAANELATIWIKGPMVAGIDYVVTAHATFAGGRIDDRSFTMKCKSR